MSHAESLEGLTCSACPVCPVVFGPSGLKEYIKFLRDSMFEFVPGPSASFVQGNDGVDCLYEEVLQLIILGLHQHAFDKALGSPVAFIGVGHRLSPWRKNNPLVAIGGRRRRESITAAKSARHIKSPVVGFDGA